jgi:hypothetical protein
MSAVNELAEVATVKEANNLLKIVASQYQWIFLVVGIRNENSVYILGKVPKGSGVYPSNSYDLQTYIVH